MKIESIAFLKWNLIIIELLKYTTFVVFMFKGFCALIRQVNAIFLSKNALKTGMCFTLLHIIHW